MSGRGCFDVSHWTLLQLMAWVQIREPRIVEEAGSLTADRESPTFLHYSAKECGQLMSYGDAKAEILGSMMWGEISATGLENNGARAEIPARTWEDYDFHFRPAMAKRRGTFKGTEKLPWWYSLRFPVSEILRRWPEKPAASRHLPLEIPSNGLFTIEQAAAAIAAQQGWHSNAQATLQVQMRLAVDCGRLRVRHPHTHLPFTPKVVRVNNELSSVTDINDWLESDDASYRLEWDPDGENTAASEADTRIYLEVDESFPPHQSKEERDAQIRQEGYDFAKKVYATTREVPGLDSIAFELSKRSKYQNCRPRPLGAGGIRKLLRAWRPPAGTQG